MKITTLFLCISLGLVSAIAQTNADKLFNSTWKIQLDRNSAHEFTVTATAGKVKMEGNMLIFPQCYTWDYYFKIVTMTDSTLILERYDYDPQKLKSTEDALIRSGDFYYFKKVDLSLEQFKLLNAQEKHSYLRLDI